jgi:peptide/nickel transport system ATP-binding protein
MSENTSARAVHDDVLEVRGLSVSYATPGGPLPVISSVDLTLRRGEFLGLAGESGCGKSTLALAISRLLPAAGTVTGGSVLFRSADAPPADVLALEGERLRAFRWRRMSMVFQSAMNSLNPVMRVGPQIADAIRAHDRQLRRAERMARCAELLDLVGVGSRHLRSYPHELSGGMRQRIMLAMALCLSPEIVLMDEPTTALDVVVQREILDEVRALQARLGFSVLFITHDMSLLLDLADRIAVMYGGGVVEEAPAAAMIADAAHPYTIGLLESFPALDGPVRELTGIPGAPPSLRQLPGGCLFAPRCPRAAADCLAQRPALRPGLDPDRAVACFHPAGTQAQPSRQPEKAQP